MAGALLVSSVYLDVFDILGVEGIERPKTLLSLAGVFVGDVPGIALTVRLSLACTHAWPLCLCSPMSFPAPLSLAFLSVRMSPAPPQHHPAPFRGSSFNPLRRPVRWA